MEEVVGYISAGPGRHSLIKEPFLLTIGQVNIEVEYVDYVFRTIRFGLKISSEFFTVSGFFIEAELDKSGAIQLSGPGMITIEEPIFNFIRAQYASTLAKLPELIANQEKEEKRLRVDYLQKELESLAV